MGLREAKEFGFDRHFVEQCGCATPKKLLTSDASEDQKDHACVGAERA
jgi:hypothetical protein